MPTAKIILWVYAILMLGGGIMGFMKAGSKISLIAGLISGLLVIIGLIISNTNAQLGIGIVAATSALLCISFLMRLLKTQSFMPSGMLLVLSVVALSVSVIHLIQK